MADDGASESLTLIQQAYQKHEETGRLLDELQAWVDDPDNVEFSEYIAKRVQYNRLRAEWEKNGALLRAQDQFQAEIVRSLFTGMARGFENIARGGSDGPPAGHEG